MTKDVKKTSTGAGKKVARNPVSGRYVTTPNSTRARSSRSVDVAARGMKIPFPAKGRGAAEAVDDTGLDQLDPATGEARDASHFRRIIAARRNIEAAEQELRDAVAAAREAGDSWTVIGAALETSRQNAFQRFGR
jgi:hypothetical protein